MQDTSKPPRLPVPPGAQTRAVGVLKRTGTEQTTVKWKERKPGETKH